MREHAATMNSHDPIYSPLVTDETFDYTAGIVNPTVSASVLWQLLFLQAFHISIIFIICLDQRSVVSIEVYDDIFPRIVEGIAARVAMLGSSAAVSGRRGLRSKGQLVQVGNVQIEVEIDGSLLTIGSTNTALLLLNVVF